MQTEIEAICRRPITSLIEAVKTEASRRNLQTVGLLASPSTLATGIYEQIKTKKLQQIVTLSVADQARVASIIRRVIAGDTTLSSELEPLMLTLRANGAEAIILGCSELSVLCDGKLTPKLVDPLQLVIRNLLEL